MATYSNRFFFQAEDGIRDRTVTGVQTCALPILQSQGLGSLRLYFENMEKDAKSKADVQFLKHAKAQEAIQLAAATQVEHPKLAQTGWIVRKKLMEKSDSKHIVFAHYRQTEDRNTQDLTRIPS